MIFLGCFIILIVVLFNVAVTIQNSYEEQCEQRKKELIESGIPEDIVNQELLSNHYIL